MEKFIVIIGQSASGKTTYVMDEIVKGAPLTLVDKPVPHTTFDDYCLLGDYTSPERTKGTDRLSYAILPQLLEFITEYKDKFKVFVAEGDRINSSKFFNHLKALSVPVTVRGLICDLEVSFKRRRECGSKESEEFVRATQTKTLNNIKLAKSLGFETIVSDTRTKHNWW